MSEVIEFLMHVAASALGVLVGVWLASMWDKQWKKIKRRNSGIRR